MAKNKKKTKKEVNSSASQKTLNSVGEIFEVKGKTIQKEGVVEEVKEDKGQIEHQNKLLRNILIIIGLLAIFFIVGYFLANSFRTFSYEGLDWDIIESGDLTFYHTSFPVYNQSVHVANHNVFFRNDPRVLEKNIPFEGNFLLKPMMVVELDKRLNCEGSGIASQASMEQVLNAWRAKVIVDPQAQCDDQGRYTYFKMIPGNETKIVNTQASCYTVYVNNCEVFEAKERFLVEGFKAINALDSKFNN